MDFVYICRDGENEELRYSIRSVLNSFPEAKVWLVGGKPEWYSGHCVPVEQNSNKYANALKNLKSLCEHPEISDNFVLMNDDFFIIKKINSIDQFYNGLLSDKINRFTQITGSSMYIKKLITTNKKLIDLGIKNPIDYELHTPMPMNKPGLLDVIEKYPECLWRSMFGNLYNVGGTQMDDVKIYVNKRHLARSNEITDSSIYMSTEDTSLKVMLDKMLRQMLPEPSIYEKIK
jgi:hypothetical protein